MHRVWKDTTIFPFFFFCSVFILVFLQLVVDFFVCLALEEASLIQEGESHAMLRSQLTSSVLVLHCLPRASVAYMTT